MYPDPVSTDKLVTGQVGYIILGMKTVKEAFMGDTFHHSNIPTNQITLFKGFTPAKPTVYAGLYPLDQSEYVKLSESIDRLTLNDASVFVMRESSVSLGQGWRLGFLGTLHMDVFKQRLEEEHNAQVINTMPTVPYKLVYQNGEEALVNNPLDFPDNDGSVKSFQEPIVRGTLIFPQEYLGAIITLCGVSCFINYLIMQSIIVVKTLITPIWTVLG